jgi:hypothetical protein
MSDGWQSTTNQPVINVILDVDGMVSLHLAGDCPGADKTMTFIRDVQRGFPLDQRQVSPCTVFHV